MPIHPAAYLLRIDGVRNAIRREVSKRRTEQIRQADAGKTAEIGPGALTLPEIATIADTTLKDAKARIRQAGILAKKGRDGQEYFERDPLDSYGVLTDVATFAQLCPEAPPGLTPDPEWLNYDDLFREADGGVTRSTITNRVAAAGLQPIERIGQRPYFTRESVIRSGILKNKKKGVGLPVAETAPPGTVTPEQIAEASGQSVESVRSKLSRKSIGAVARPPSTNRSHYYDRKKCLANGIFEPTRQNGRNS